MTDRLSLLVGQPHLGRPRLDLRPGLRSFLTDNDVILYRIEGSDVVILRILHGSRDIDSLLRG